MATTEIDEFGTPIADIDVEFAKMAGFKVHDKTEEASPASAKTVAEVDEGNAERALIAEAVAAGHVAFEWNGETYTVPPADDWDVEVLENAEDGRFVSAVRALVGPDQWAKFKRTKRKNSELQDLFDAAQKALGTKPGE